MTDLKDKLEQLKRERDARSRSQSIKNSRSQSIKNSWSELEKDETLTTKEKLEALINLRPEREKRAETPRPGVAVREPLQFTEVPYALDARYGQIVLADGLKISGHLLACLSREPGFEDLDLSTALFFDLETTGLSGGTGTVPFNIGLGYYRDDKFWVGQYFLGELAEEERMLKEFAQLVSDMDFQSLVSYNGKTFDLPLLETRFILHRIPFRLQGLPHLDFLFPARNLWQHKYENCKLSYLARQLLHSYREDDIPSSEVPWRYFQYLQTGDFTYIEPVLYHNSEDILSLLGLVIMGASVFSDGPDACTAGAMDFFGAGKILEKAGQAEKAANYFEKALNGSLSDEVGLSTRRRLASQYKRSGTWEKAVSLWKQMADSEFASSDLLFSLRELSMYYEHREKQFTLAHRYAEEGFVMAMGFSSHYEQDFSRRKDRLKQKLKKEKIAKPEDEVEKKGS
jgi:uncharacterized protein YprB with RNaseH-like and TPR domain